MGLRKHPGDGGWGEQNVRKGFMGVKWTQWTFPGLAARAIYRKLAKRPGDPYAPRRVKLAQNFSLAYLFCSFALFTAVMAHIYQQPAEETESYSDGYYPAMVVKKEELASGEKRVRHIRFRGFSVVKDEDITEATIQQIEANERSRKDRDSKP